jgi:hypothetical protein
MKDRARSHCDRAAAEGDQIAGYVRRPIRDVVSARWSSLRFSIPVTAVRAALVPFADRAVLRGRSTPHRDGS